MTHRRDDAEQHAAAVALAAACRRLRARGLMAGAEGNRSVRLSDSDLLVTLSGVDKGAVEATAMLRLAADGTRRHEGTAADCGRDGAGGDRAGRPSSELMMPLACYAARADVRAVVHAHPPVATGFATAGISLPANVLPEVSVVVGRPAVRGTTARWRPYARCL